MVLHCQGCNVSVECEESGFYHIKGDPLGTKYSLFKCPNCWEPILTSQIEIVELNEIVLDDPIVLFPNNDVRLNPSIPEDLRTALLEAIHCQRASAYTSSVIMCRRALEGFAFIQGVKEKNLKVAINKLNKLGIINQQLCEWADELRLSGNKAAHDIHSTFSKEDAKDILDFTIAILDFTYSYKLKFDQFKSRQLKSIK